MAHPLLIAQISDCHIGGDDGVLPRLERALAAIAKFEPDVLIATGDLVQNAAPEEYAALADALARLDAPSFLLPGNHDDPTALRRAFPDHVYLPEEGPLCYSIDHLPVRIVAVDQTMPGLTAGVFTPEHAEWLHMVLAEAPRTPTIVALHHPPFATYTPFDAIGLEGAELFAAIIERHRQVERITCGHVHRPMTGRVAHASVTVCPSTAWSYASRFDDGRAAKIDEPPGFLLHAWTARDGLVTHTMSAG